MIPISIRSPVKLGQNQKSAPSSVLRRLFFLILMISLLHNIHISMHHLSHPELISLYKSSGAFVLSSHGEGWGRPVVEAMSMEMPVIVTDWSGPSEYLTEENSFPLPISPGTPGPVSPITL